LSINRISSPAPLKERRDAGPSYISLNASITGDCNDAATCMITQSGQLMCGGELLSTTGFVPNAPFAPSSNIAAISTNFSVSDGVLHWNNTAFVGNQALFCQTDSMVVSVFNGQLPSGCAQVALSLLLVSPTSCSRNGIASSASGNLPTSASTRTASVTDSTSYVSAATSPTGSSSYPGTLNSNGVTADLIGGYAYAPTTTVLSGVNEHVVSLEQCLAFCVGHAYFGLSEGMRLFNALLQLADMTERYPMHLR
jgi:hypothetical protein